MNFNPSIIAMDGDIAYSKSTVSVWVGIPATPFEFLDENTRVSYARRFDSALTTLVPENRELNAHLVITSTPFNDQNWVEKLGEQAEKFDPSPYFGQMLGKMRNRVSSAHFREKKVYLALELGRRSEFGKSTGFLSPLNNIIGSFGEAVKISDPLVNDKELNFWREKAKDIRHSLMNGNLKAIQVSANEIIALVQRPYWPGMDVPVVSHSDREQWGTGEISGIAVAEIENNRKYLKITQDTPEGEKVGYRATLCFSRFPDEMDFPDQEPWMHYASLLSSPVDLYSRFSIVPARKVRSDVDKKIKDAKDQMENASKSGNSIPIAIQEQLEVGQSLEYILERDRTPWVYGRHRLVVEAPTLDLLKERANGAIEHYKNLNIDVAWPSSDQLRLLMESQPADEVRVKSYYQRQSLSIISAGVPAGTGSVGDDVTINGDGSRQGWIGPYIGYTTSRVVEPVFMSLHSAIARNNPPGCIITGSPGGGKSFAAFTITYLMALQNVWTIYIDPKADALPMVNLPGLGKPKVFDLQKGQAGILDPFKMADTLAEQRILATDIVELFIGNQLSAAQKTALDDAVWDVSEHPNPSLYKVVDRLLELQDDKDGRSVGTNLRMVRDLPFAKLCFDPDADSAKTMEILRPDDGLTIITLLGLDFPNPNSKSMTTPNRLAVGILYLLTQYTKKLMESLDKEHPKAVIIDEAWAITSTEQGARMIPSIARMGRSLNTALILVSQNAGDFLQGGDNLTNNLAFRMAFRSRDQREIDDVLEFYGLEKNEDNREVIRTLRNGECLMRDVDGRIARTQIDGWNHEMKIAFETNPAKKKANAEQAMS